MGNELVQNIRAVQSGWVAQCHTASAVLARATRMSHGIRESRCRVRPWRATRAIDRGHGPRAGGSHPHGRGEHSTTFRERG